MEQTAEQEVRALGPDYCYVCQKLIKKSQKSLCVGRDSSGEEYRRHDSCAPGSGKWMRSEAASHPSYQKWTRLFLQSKKHTKGGEEDGEVEYTWEDIHDMEMEGLVDILNSENVPPEDYEDMTTTEIADTLCVMLKLKRSKQKEEEDE